MKIKQTKDQNNTCRVTAWLQNEVVVNAALTGRNYDSGIGLYVAGDYGQVIDGQVRNFSFVNK